MAGLKIGWNSKKFYQKMIRAEFKGQLISKANFQAANSSKKRRNEFVLLLCDVFSFVFWKKLKTPKKPFEIT